MERRYSEGYVYKHHGYWYAGVRCYEGDKKKLVSKSMRVKCHPDKVDDQGNVIKHDNRGKATAEERMREWRDGLIREAESESSPADSTMALIEYCEHYLAYLHVEDVTMDGYRAALKWVRRMPLGGMELREITPDDVRKWDQSLRDEGLSEYTVKHYHDFVAQVFNYAVDAGVIQKVPIARRSGPKAQRRPPNPATPETRHEILARADEEGPTAMGTTVRIAVQTGMRRGEICALRWQDIDFTGEKIHVTHALTKDSTPGRGWKIKSPKNTTRETPRRDISINPTLLRHLQERKARQQEELAEFDMPWSDAIFVTGDAVRGTWMNPDMVNRKWKVFASRPTLVGTQGRPLDFNDLRHTFASLAMRHRTLELMSLASTLGHKDVSVTLNIYADAYEESKRAGMLAMDETL